MFILFLALLLFTDVHSVYQANRNGLWMRYYRDNSFASASWATATMYDVILPGAHKAGCYQLPTDDYWKSQFCQTGNGPALQAALGSQSPDFYWNTLVAWSTTQNTGISFQITKGIRWFDFLFEYHVDSSGSGNSGWRIACDLYGPTMQSIFGGFNDYSASATGEVFVLDIQLYTPDNTKYDEFWDFVFGTGGLGTALVVPTSTDLSTALVVDLQTSYSFIVFSDQVPASYSNLVFDSTSLLVGASADTSSAGQMIDSNREVLIQGWASNVLHRTYWQLTPQQSDLTSAVTNNGMATIGGQPVGSLESLNTQVVFQLQSSIDFVPFGFSGAPYTLGHTLLVDYVSQSDVVEQSIRLNYNYQDCYDTRDSLECVTARDNFDFTTYATQCNRTFGECPYLNKTMRTSCTDNSDCVDFYSTSDGACFHSSDIITDPSQLQYYTNDDFCLISEPIVACVAYDDYLAAINGYSSCSSTGSMTDIETEYLALFENSCENCANDAQCVSGLCNQQYQICINPPAQNNQTDFIIDRTPKLAYVYEESSQCVEFRDSIDFWRFRGDPDADFQYEKVNELVEEVQKKYFPSDPDDPYLESIYCFTLFPLILGFFMLVVLVCMPCCWCSSKLCGWHESYEKYCCQFKKGKKYARGQIIVPFLLLFAYSFLILFFCANAIVMNGEISDNILEDGGVIDLMNTTVNVATDYMNNVLGPTNILVDSLDQAFDDAQELVDSTGATETLINDTAVIAQTVTSKWAAQGLDVVIVHNDGIYVFGCGYVCDTVIASLAEVNTDISTQALQATEDMYDAVDGIQTNMLDDEESIMGDILNYQTQVQMASDQTDSARISVLETMESIEAVEDNRSIAFAIFFMIPMLLLILGTVACFQNSQKMFQGNYCLAFILSAVTWILFGIFNITVVIWADTCVRLDIMEQDIPNSTLLDQVYSDDTVKLVMDACLNGKYLPDSFDVSETINFKDIENDIYSQLTVDLTSAFDIPSLTSYENFVSTVDASMYEYTVDMNITVYNQMWNPSTQLSRAYLAGTDPSFTAVPGTEPLVAQIQDWYDVEQLYMGTTLTDTANEFKTESQQIFVKMETLETYSIDVLQANLTAIKCSLDPVFEQTDILLYDNKTAWCNEVGQVYGQMKSKACGDLFTNFEYTNRSLLVVAIFSTFIGFFSVMLGRRINNKFDLFGKKSHDFEIQMAEKWA